jgi:two-component system, NarL family, sensor histidine kinase DegS
MVDVENSEIQSPVDEFIEYSVTELEQVRTGLKEIILLVEQSTGEVDKLAQRNATITSQIHQLQAQFETLPREDIRATYESAQDAQQRLFTMRGQLEKLQSDQDNLRRYESYLVRALGFVQGGAPVVAEEIDSSPQSLIVQIIEAQEEERRRISRQIHDGPAQSLSNFILQTEIALRLFDVDQARAREELENLKTGSASTFAQVRDFIFDLRPMMLDDLGMIPTVRRYTEAFMEKTGLEINLIVTGSERRLESHLEVLCFRAIQSVLGHVRDHAQATQVKLMLSLDDDFVRVTIEDNGKHATGDEIDGDLREDEDLLALNERLGQAGGTFEISSQSERGATINFTIPTGD